MKFYIDFEATSPENEIIAIGAVAENGNTFYSLVKPQLSSINQYISQLTHISSENVEQAETIDAVLKSFDLWIMEQDSNIMTNRFLSYGDDKDFIKATLPAITDEHAFITAAYLYTKLENVSKEIFTFFKGTISLINAFNYVESLEKEQIHNPLDDAKMLQCVFEKIQTITPPEVRPSKAHYDDVYTTPSGIFYCKGLGKNSQVRQFDSCEDAITWIINTRIPLKDRGSVHRDRIMRNIMKAIKKKNSTYANYIWWRNKNGKIEGENI